jgi:hypothetical protein
MTAITALRFAQSREIDLNIFLEGCRLGSSRLFRSPDHKSSDSYLIIHSDQTTKLSKAWAVTVTLLNLPASLAMEATTGLDNFSLLVFIEESFLCKTKEFFE